MSVCQRFDAIDLRDVWVIQRSEQLGFALKASKPLFIVDEALWQNLDNDVTLELGVVRPIDFAHAARAERGGDLVVGKRLADHRVLPWDSTSRNRQDATFGP